MKEPLWRRSTRCGSNACVEVKAGNGLVRVRDSKTGQILTFTDEEWRAFVEGAKNGEFDV